MVYPAQCGRRIRLSRWQVWDQWPTPSARQSYSGFGWDSPWGGCIVRTSGSYVSTGAASKGFHFFTTSKRCLVCLISIQKIYGRAVIAMGERFAGPLRCPFPILISEFNTNYLEYEKYMLSPALLMKSDLERGMLLQATSGVTSFSPAVSMLNKIAFVFCNLLQVFVQEKYLRRRDGDMKLVYHNPRSLSEMLNDDCKSGRDSSYFR